MLLQYGTGRQNGRRKALCTAGCLSWFVIVSLGLLAGCSLYLLQASHKELASLRQSVDQSEVQRRSLSEEVSRHQQRIAQAEQKAESVRKERDDLQALHKDTSTKLIEAKKGAQNTSALLVDLNARLAATENKLAASEKEIKEITVKAGTCQQQFATLNADCATLKQGLANMGLGAQVDEKMADPKEAGALDPRGGMEAAKVLKDHSQQPWKASQGTPSKPTKGASSRVQVRQPSLLHDGNNNLAGTDVDETGPGLEKALAQAGAGSQLKSL